MIDSLLERVTAAAEERHLSHNSLLAYRRTWLKIVAWAAAEGLVTLPSERVGEFYATLDALLALLYKLAGKEWQGRAIEDTFAEFDRFGSARETHG